MTMPHEHDARARAWNAVHALEGQALDVEAVLGRGGCGIVLKAFDGMLHRAVAIKVMAQQLAPLLKDHLVISIAAGIRASDICRWLGGHARVVRAMPNTPALVRAAVTGLYALPGVSAQQKQHAEAILAAVGSVLWLEREELLDALTAVSGSGPAYVFYFIEALQQAARELGLDAAQARQLSLETFLGAARLASQSDEDAATLRARVTSKGGTTERALQSMEHDGVRSAIARAIHAAHERARELGDEFGKE